ncbi:MAG: C40 family peptidase [Eubacterium sp.]|nr:C40 family peptidase [Eubacterium sp.]
MKKIISLLLSLVMLLSTVAVMSLTAEAATVSSTSIVTYAKSLEGKSYKWNTHGPDTFDCSGFVYYVFKHYGITLSTASSSYWSNPTNYGTKVTGDSNAKPGDICVWSGHVGICIGNGKVVNALNASAGVCETTIKNYKNSSGTTNPSHFYIRVKGVNYGTVSPSQVNFNANGGSGSMAAISVTYPNKFTLPANTFTRTGYQFAGWNSYRVSDSKWYTLNGKGWQTASNISKNGYSKKVYGDKWSGTLDDSWMASGATSGSFTFYATWTPNRLNVTYNSNGGTATASGYYVGNGSNIYKSADSTLLTQVWTYDTKQTYGLYNGTTFGLRRTGYVFSGNWATTPTGTTGFNEDDTSLLPQQINAALKNGNCSQTLYAIWTPCTHSYSSTVEAKASCTQTGTKKYTCSICGYSYTTTLAKTSHSYDSGKVTTQPTTTATGVKTYTCSVCGATKTETLDKLPVVSVKNGWIKADGKWYYYKNDAKQTGWQKVSGKWYYLNSAGVMQTGWIKLSGKWYYLNASGAMLTGWQKIGGKWYYLNSLGAMHTGWIKDGGKWYYLNASGAMLANTSQKIGNKTYKFNASGVCTNP